MEKSGKFGIIDKEGGLRMYSVWKNVLADIERQVSAAVFSTFFHNVELVKYDNEVATITVPNVFIEKQMETKYEKYILRALAKNNIKVAHLSYIVPKGKNVVKREVNKVSHKASPTTLSSLASKSEVKNYTSSGGPNLKPDYRMDNFVVGSGNDLAASVARAVIDNPGTKYNPFFLYGRPGLGKTHLVQAVGNELLKRNPNLKVLYVPINHFYTEFIQSVRMGKGEDFSKKYRSLDVLIIDDFQFIVGKEQSQVEFFHIFNDLFQQDKQIIITSDRLPGQIKTVDERLASRLACNGAFDLQMPGFEDKCAILRAKADFEGKEIEQEAIEYIAENVKTNIRDLESEYTTVMALSDLKGISPLDLIRNGYTGVSHSGSGSSKIVSPRQVVEKTAKYYQLDLRELKSRSRVANIKNARQVAMYILSRELEMSTTKIAPEVGVGDHTTVMNGIRRVERDLKLDFALREQIEEIKREIYS